MVKLNLLMKSMLKELMIYPICDFHNQEYGYINDRLEEYKPISDQLDQLF